ncbi:inhibin beta chain [Harmonia axyridis]|uniref:inhibin beta chain n=1 Tax=Harmonia axyridis TaxID=115357 RepID=UPI001E275D96|nr:inhibin beta chain [Harmonia axyridis]
MAVQSYNLRKSFKNWVIQFSCFYLLFSTIGETLVGCERLRHHSHSEDVYVSQLEENLGSKKMSSCPNCVYRNGIKDHKVESDNLRLEVIKKQILSKLGLRDKPNVTYSLPREVVLETLYRAENSEFFNTYRDEDFVSTTSARSESKDQMDVDDFYGRTSEIISFAEEGSIVNQNRLLEFRVSSEVGHAGQEFNVRSATLWVKADLVRTREHKCRTQIFVFKIISQLPESITLSSQDFNRAMSEPITLTLEETRSGWQKLNVTSIISKWLSESRTEKLQLLVDCSCCSHWHVHIFNREIDKISNKNRPFLVIHTDPNSAKRVRRRAIDCSAESGNQCCKQRFYVSFKQLGWEDWVIAPPGYYANYCRGDCGHPRTPDTYNNFHTHVIEEVRKTHHLSGMQPCCAPLKFSSMSLIYYGPNLDVIKRDMPKMVVDECGCP